MAKSLHSHRHKLIATSIAQQRRAANLTQAQVAKALGRYQSFVANVESGERRIDLVELIDLAKIIGLDVRGLVDRISSEPG